jgi:hypothetical protein
MEFFLQAVTREQEQSLSMGIQQREHQEETQRIVGAGQD